MLYALICAAVCIVCTAACCIELRKRKTAMCIVNIAFNLFALIWLHPIANKNNCKYTNRSKGEKENEIVLAAWGERERNSFGRLLFQFYFLFFFFYFCSFKCNEKDNNIHTPTNKPNQSDFQTMLCVPRKSDAVKLLVCLFIYFLFK